MAQDFTERFTADALNHILSDPNMLAHEIDAGLSKKDAIYVMAWILYGLKNPLSKVKATLFAEFWNEKLEDKAFNLAARAPNFAFPVVNAPLIMNHTELVLEKLSMLPRLHALLADHKIFKIADEIRKAALAEAKKDNAPRRRLVVIDGDHVEDPFRAGFVGDDDERGLRGSERERLGLGQIDFTRPFE